ncbi:MAG TPA: outer membrane protein transport protein [Verrucomicrobiae bacterium]|nr:outer membrane protein transport protein [Verrucomicrobiae bacterium]
MKSSQRLALSAAIAGASTLPQLALAGGFSLYEISTPDVGLASAGYAARAQDASTVYKNPAGMSLLDGPQVQAGAQLTYGNVTFSKNDNTGPLLGSDNGGNAVGALPGASLFLTHQLSDRFAVGFGTFSSFGLASKYNSDWVGRYYIQQGALLGVSLMPAASFKATDWLSVGAGLNAMYGYLDNKVAVRTAGAGDGQMKIQDSTWGFGGDAGILVEPVKGTRIGVTYVSPVKLDFKATPSFSNLGILGNQPIFSSPPQLNLGMTVPQSVMLSAYHELNAKWAVMANVGWQNWSQFGKVDVGVDSANPQSLTANLNYQDTWHGAIGAQYHASDKWQFSGGFAYDSSSVSDANRTLSAPMGEAYRIGVGAQYQLSEKLNLGAAYEFMWGGDMPVTQNSTYRGNVSGGFNGTWFSFFTLNASWKF